MQAALATIAAKWPHIALGKDLTLPKWRSKQQEHANLYRLPVHSFAESGDLSNLNLILQSECGINGRDLVRSCFSPFAADHTQLSVLTDRGPQPAVKPRNEEGNTLI